jgi:hypothetical protein
MYGKTHKGKHPHEGNMHIGKHREIYTCGDTYRDIYGLGDIFAWCNTYA